MRELLNYQEVCLNKNLSLIVAEHKHYESRLKRVLKS